MKTWGWVRKVGAVALTVGLVEYLAVPQLLKARSELNLFTDASMWLLLVAFALALPGILSHPGYLLAGLGGLVRWDFWAWARGRPTGRPGQRDRARRRLSSG